MAPSLRLPDSSQFRLLEGLADAVVVSDRSHRVLYVNTSAERLFGWPGAELLGQPLTVLMPERMRAVHETGFHRFLRTRQPHLFGRPVRVPALTRDGRELDVELTLSTLEAPLPGTEAPLLLASMRDLRMRVELERQLASQRHVVAGYAVMSILTEARTFDDAAPQVLGALADALGWEVGLFWKADRRGPRLRLGAEWAAPSLAVEAFLEASRTMTFGPGEGLPGQVWQTRQTLWSMDVGRDFRYLRGPIAAEVGLEGALFFPVACANEPHGVMEFLCRHPREPDAELLRAMAMVGFQIGQFLERVRTEEALRTERNNLHTLFVHAPAAIAVIRGDDFRYELSNPQNQQLAGGRKLVGRTVSEALPELDAQGLKAMLEQVYRTGEPLVGKEVPVRVPDDEGRERELFLNGIYQPLPGEDGKVSGVMAFAYDVTEQVRARQQAEEAARSVVLMADAVPQIIWTTDARGQADFFNQRWYEYTGLTEAESRAQSWERICHPEDLPGVVERWRTCFAQGTPFEGELRMLRARDRTWRWHLTRTVPQRNARGEVVRWIGSSTDIEDQKRSEHANRFLSEASAALGASLDYEATLTRVASLVVPRLADWCVVHLAGDDPRVPRQLVVAHRDSQKVAWAREVAARFPPSPEAPSGVHQVLRTGEPELYPEITDAMLEQGARGPEHLRTLREAGMRSVMIVPLTARGQTFGTLTFVAAESGTRYGPEDLRLARDIADRAAQAVENARLYDGAQEAIRVRDDFLSVASHELRTPLTPLQLHLQSLQQEVRQAGPGVLPARVVAKLDDVSRQVSRLGRLVSSLLDVSRIARQQLELHDEPLDLTTLVEELAARYREEAAQKGSALVVRTPGVPVVGNLDRLRMDQVVSNLLANALKFGAGSPVELSLERAGAKALLRVKDGGIGISPLDQARIFGRYERAAPSRHYGGMGLGLWIVKQIVEAEGGDIRVESAPGEGATFVVTLPLERGGSGGPAE